MTSTSGENPRRSASRASSRVGDVTRANWAAAITRGAAFGSAPARAVSRTKRPARSPTYARVSVSAQMANASTKACITAATDPLATALFSMRYSTDSSRQSRTGSPVADTRDRVSARPSHVATRASSARRAASRPASARSASTSISGSPASSRTPTAARRSPSMWANTNARVAASRSTASRAGPIGAITRRRRRVAVSPRTAGKMASPRPLMISTAGTRCSRSSASHRSGSSVVTVCRCIESSIHPLERALEDRRAL